MAGYSPDNSYPPGSAQTTFSAYPEPGSSNSPRAPYPPGIPGYGYASQDTVVQQPLPAPHPQPARRGSKSDGDQNGRAGNRLRKACDNCSVRKVKCDDGPPPCKACQAIDIECKFERPSKRRGPPNKLAEKIKRQKLEEAEAGNTLTQHSEAFAAQSLASLAQQPSGHPMHPPEGRSLHQESIDPIMLGYHIMDPQVLSELMQEYFVFIHPVIPMPHEATFWTDFDRYYNHDPRQGPPQGVDPSFVPLVAAMVSVLTSSFPRCPRDILKKNKVLDQYNSSMSLIQTCQTIIDRCSNVTYDRKYTVNDAIISYLQGVLNISLGKEVAAVRHYKECLANLVSLGLHKASPIGNSANGDIHSNSLASSSSQKDEWQRQYTQIDREMAQRVFWNCFASVRSREQLGSMPSELWIPPATRASPWPLMPAEVNDEQIQEDQIVGKAKRDSELVGFNINVRIFDSYRLVSDKECLHGVDELVNWREQKNDIVKSLERVKEIVRNLPEPYRLKPTENASDDLHPPQTYPGTDAGPFSRVKLNAESPEARRNIMINIQKANIHATQLGTRSYLVEKFFNLSDANNIRRNKNSPPMYSQEDGDDALQQSMKAEWNEIINGLLQMISTMDAIYMEPNGASLIAKIRSIGRTLINIPESRRDVLNHDEADSYLERFTQTLGTLEITVNPSYESVHEHDDEASLRIWANLKDQQQRFINLTNQTKA